MQNWIELCEEISKKFDIDEDKVYLLFSMTAAKPLKKFKPGSELWNNILKNIAISINNNERITRKQIEFWLCENGIPLKTEIISPGRIAKKVMVNPEIIQTGDLKSRINSLKSALTPGQVAILNDIMKLYDHDDELGAMSLALIWAKERIKNEKSNL